MNKKYYQSPTVIILAVEVQQLVCESPATTPIAGEGETPAGGWGPGNSRDYDDWDD